MQQIFSPPPFNPVSVTGNAYQMIGRESTEVIEDGVLHISIICLVGGGGSRSQPVGA